MEGVISAAALQQLASGIIIAGRKTLPCQAEAIDPPELPERIPPIRVRKNIPTSWLSLTLHEGRNRQVRHMTAAAGFPTLRLVRAAIGSVTLMELAAGAWRHLTSAELSALRGPNSQSGKSRATAATRPNRG